MQVFAFLSMGQADLFHRCHCDPLLILSKKIVKLVEDLKNTKDRVIAAGNHAQTLHSCGKYSKRTTFATTSNFPRLTSTKVLTIPNSTIPKVRKSSPKRVDISVTMTQICLAHRQKNKDLHKKIKLYKKCVKLHKK